MGAKKTGKYRSKFEARFAKLLKQLRIKFEYECDNLEYSASVYRGRCLDCGSDNVVSRHVYLCDFKTRQGKGDYIFVETKGKLTPSERTKILNILKANPDITFKLVFQYNNKLNKRSKTRYLDWANKNNVDARVIGEVTKEWLLET